MSKKVFNLITGVVGGVSAVAVALVTYFQPTNATAINAAIPLVSTCVIEVCNLFVKEDA